MIVARARLGLALAAALAACAGPRATTHLPPTTPAAAPPPGTAASASAPAAPRGTAARVTVTQCMGPFYPSNALIGRSLRTVATAHRGDVRLDQSGADERCRGEPSAAQPVVFVNARRIVGTQSYDAYEAAVLDEIGRLDSLAPSPSPPPPADGPIAWEPPRPAISAERHPIHTDGAPARGPRDARITLVEFADFDDPATAAAQATVRAAEAEHAGRIRLVWKHQPMAYHRHALRSAEAAAVAAAQGRFWPMHDRLFAAGTLGPQAIDDAARAAGLDMERFHSDLDEGRFRAAVEDDAAEGFAVGAEEAPAFFVNGRRLPTPLRAGDLEQAIQQELHRPAAPGAPAAPRR